MLDERLLKRADGVLPYFYHLRSHVKAYNEQNYKHEKICGDIYIALQKYIKYWDSKYYDDFLSSGLRYDRQSIISGKIIFWEIDRATETHAKIIRKIEKYLEISRTLGKRFIVVFACPRRRARMLLTEFQGFKNSSVHFYAVDYKALCTDPTAEIFLSPVTSNGTRLIS